MKGHTVVLVLLALVLAVRGCHIENSLNAELGELDAALALARADAESIQAARIAEQREDSAATAEMRREIAMWRTRKAEADRVAARAAERAESAAQAFLAESDSTQAALFEEYRAEVTVELEAWKARATDAERQVEAVLLLMARKDALLDTMAREIAAKDRALARAVEAIAGRDDVIRAQARQKKLWQFGGTALVGLAIFQSLR